MTRNSTTPPMAPPVRRRRPVTAALGLGLALALAGCGTGNGADPSETAGSSTPVETVTQAPSPTATATVTQTASATPSGSGSGGAGGETPAGATETYTTESGAFTWTFPQTWTASQEEYSEDSLDFVGEPYEVTLFHHPDLGVEYRATTGMGATDNDGPKPEVVAVLDTEELPEVPVSEGADAVGSGPVWYRATLLKATEEIGDLGSFEGGEFLLTVQVVNVSEDRDPEDTGDAFWSSWFYEQPPAEGHDYGAAAILSGRVTQEAAQEATGLDGEEALRAFLETEEYAQLRDVATSMEVTAP
ncbi:hypothetical protein [Microbacterium sp. A93]|uniref:hypothetical protein n=1 Tax=Microbacterium sp. A93 TaxID=3450716 RepID=UPI003F42BBDC